MRATCLPPSPPASCSGNAIPDSASTAFRSHGRVKVRIQIRLVPTTAPLTQHTAIIECDLSKLALFVKNKMDLASFFFTSLFCRSREPRHALLRDRFRGGETPIFIVSGREGRLFKKIFPSSVRRIDKIGMRRPESRLMDACRGQPEEISPLNFGNGTPEHRLSALLSAFSGQPGSFSPDFGSSRQKSLYIAGG
jgi:hypothetical protein